MSVASLDVFRPDLGSPVSPEFIAQAQVQPAVDVTGFDDMLARGYDAARAQSSDWIASAHLRDIEAIIKQAHKASGVMLTNPAISKQHEYGWISRYATGRRTEADLDIDEPRRRYEKFYQAYDELRKQHPDLPDARQWRDRVGAEIKRRAAELRSAQYGSTTLGDIGEIVGELGAEARHPINLALLPIGSSSALWSAARVTFGAGVGRFLAAELPQIAKVAGVEALINAAAGAAIGAERMATLPDFGVDYDFDDLINEAGFGALLGGLVGGTLRGLGTAGRAFARAGTTPAGRAGRELFRVIDETDLTTLTRLAQSLDTDLMTAASAWRRMTPGARDIVPPELRQRADDAATVTERLDLDARENPLGEANAEAHHAAVARATEDVVQDRTVDIREALTEAVEPVPVHADVPTGRTNADRAYGDAPTLYRPPDALKEALKAVAPDWARLRESVGRGELRDPTPHLAEAAGIVAEAEARGMTVPDLIAEGYAQPSADTAAFLHALMGEDGRVAAPDVVAKRLKAFAAADERGVDHSPRPGYHETVLDLQTQVAREIERQEVPKEAVVRSTLVEDAKRVIDEREGRPASSTGLGELGDAARAMSENFYSEALDALRAGRRQMVRGVPDPFYDLARQEFAAGRIASTDDLRALYERYDGGERAASAKAKPEEDFMIPDGEGVFRSAREVMAEAEAAEKASEAVLACVIGAAL